MRRGFKASAERCAISAREELGLTALCVLSPWAYADHLGILVFGADELDLPQDHADQLLNRDPDSWSGMTLDEDNVKLVVLNSAQSKARQCSTLMHEIAHILLGHVPASAEISPSGMVLLSDYSDEQEEEADWLGAALLLPEGALLHYRGQGMSAQEVALIFGVSNDLCIWRCRMSGVEKRLNYRRR